MTISTPPHPVHPFPMPVSAIISGSLESGSCTTAIVDLKANLLRIDSWTLGELSGWYIKRDTESVGLDQIAVERLAEIVAAWTGTVIGGSVLKAKIDEVGDRMREMLEPIFASLVTWRHGRQLGDNGHDDRLIAAIDELEPRLDKINAADDAEGQR